MNYSCKTSLLNLCDGILNGMEHGLVTAVTVMYLSAVFDMVDRDCMLDMFQKQFGITGVVLDCLESHLIPCDHVINEQST